MSSRGRFARMATRVGGGSSSRGRTAAGPICPLCGETIGERRGVPFDGELHHADCLLYRVWRRPRR